MDCQAEARTLRRGGLKRSSLSKRRGTEDPQCEDQYMPSQLCDDVTSEYVIQATLKAIEDVANGRLPQWQCTGNAWTVVLRPNGATFEYANHVW